MPAWTPKRIKHLREVGYEETQEQFRRRLGVSIETLRFWEQERGKPNGSARLLLDRLEAEIAYLRSRLNTRT